MLGFGAGNLRRGGRRHRGVTTVTSALLTLTIALSLGLGALAAGTRAGRALQKRYER